MTTNSFEQFAVLGAVIGAILVLKHALKTETKPGGFSAIKPLTAPEQILYRKLVNALPNHVVLAQVAYSQFIRHADFKTFGTMRQKVADFVICNQDFKIIGIVELDDRSHFKKTSDDASRDAKAASAGIRTTRWTVSRMPEPEEIRAKILG
jgi:very-short-patch-repair endonuclease